jgi:hypothetical protein
MPRFERRWTGESQPSAAPDWFPPFMGRRASLTGGDGVEDERAAQLLAACLNGVCCTEHRPSESMPFPNELSAASVSANNQVVGIVSVTWRFEVHPDAEMSGPAPLQVCSPAALTENGDVARQLIPFGA